jgi:hypothetical protein
MKHVAKISGQSDSFDPNVSSRCGGSLGGPFTYIDQSQTRSLNLYSWLGLRRSGAAPPDARQEAPNNHHRIPFRTQGSARVRWKVCAHVAVLAPRPRRPQPPAYRARPRLVRLQRVHGRAIRAEGPRCRACCARSACGRSPVRSSLRRSSPWPARRALVPGASGRSVRRASTDPGQVPSRTACVSLIVSCAQSTATDNSADSRTQEFVSAVKASIRPPAPSRSAWWAPSCTASTAAAVACCASSRLARTVDSRSKTR